MAQLAIYGSEYTTSTPNLTNQHSYILDSSSIIVESYEHPKKSELYLKIY